MNEVALKPRKLWMCRGPKGWAPYFGVTFTRKAMVARLKEEGWQYAQSIKVIPVMVYPQ